MTTEKPTLHVDRYERNWIRFSIVLLVAFFAAVTIAGFALGIQLPSPELRVDPRTVATQGPFADAAKAVADGKSPLKEISPGRYEAYILAQVFFYTPNEITVPVGSTVTFYVTSAYVQHGFKLQNTNINMQIIPGQVSKLTATFDEPGIHQIICNEFCGLGHAGMSGRIIVEG